MQRSRLTFFNLFVCLLLQLVFQAVILTPRGTYVGGHLNLKILTVLALSSGVDQQTLKTADRTMTTPNLDVNCSFNQSSMQSN